MSRRPLPEADYGVALTERIMGDLREHKLVRPHQWSAAEDLIRSHVRHVLQEVQHRIYQDAMANLSDLAAQLDRKTVRRLAASEREEER